MTNSHPCAPATAGTLVLCLVLISFLPACTASRPQEQSTALPGRQSDGSMLLPNQWSLRPAGQQVELADFPVNVAVHPGGRFAAVLHCGYSAHEVLMVDLAELTVVSRTPVPTAFYGLEFAADGNELFCSGAAGEVVHRFDFADGKLSGHRQIRVRDAAQRGIPSGLALSREGDQLFAASLWAHRVSRIQLAREEAVVDIPLAADASAPMIPPLKPSPDEDAAAANKRAEAVLYPSDPRDSFPYACRLDESRQRLYVSLWAQASVAVVDLRSNTVADRWATDEHPCEMALTKDGRRLFVANANRNTVSVFDTETGRKVETIWSALYPASPPGSTPNSLALSPDEETLFVANACNNVVAVFDVSVPGKSRSLGFIPTGWYPTSVRVTPDGRRLLIANGKGSGSRANPQGPRPGTRRTPTVEYIGSLFRGTLSVVELPEPGQLERALAGHTIEAYRCAPLKPDASITAKRPRSNPIPARPGGKSPIRYCIYIIKENRTYDQVLGDMPEGNGDPSLCLFPERVTPNHHRLAREFVLLDNFYVESEVSADGHEWSMGAYATDFVEKMWPLGYGHAESGKFSYVSEGSFPVAAPASGYLWDRARAAGVSYRSYGEFVRNGATPDQPGVAKYKTLEGHIDPHFRSFDMTYPDVKRAARFISELRRFEAEGEMPQLQIVRLPNDHTHGATPGALTPTALVGDNDLAFGQVVEAISRSRFWPNTAIFVVEDDAQNGPDHVDAHRTVAFVISPYARRGAVDSTLYSTSSMLRTMELILGLEPMTQFDAAARPMFNSFQPVPDLRPFTASPAQVDLQERNSETAWGRDLEMNFAAEDAADDLLLNEVVWRSVRGANNPMPAPVRAGFVFSRRVD